MVGGMDGREGERGARWLWVSWSAARGLDSITVMNRRGWSRRAGSLERGNLLIGRPPEAINLS